MRVVRCERQTAKMKKDHKSWEAKTLYCVVSTSFGKVVQAFAACSVSRCCSLSLSEYITTQCNVMSGSEERRASDGYRQSAVTWGEKMFVGVLGVGAQREEQRKTTNTRAAAEQQGTKRT